MRRLYPGVKVAIGPPIENGFYYDFDFPEPIAEEDLARIEEELRRELAEGREWTREERSADEAKAYFAAEDEPYKVELVDTAEGDDQLLHAGRVHRPLPRPAPPDLRADQGREAHRPRGRLLARRLDRSSSSPGSTAPPSTVRRTSTRTSQRLEEAKRRDHRRLGTDLDIFHFDPHSPGSPLWHPKGMVVWNELEDLRRRENRSAATTRSRRR